MYGPGARTRRGRPDAALWPRFRSPAGVLSLAPGPRGIRTVNPAKASNCAFWASLGAHAADQVGRSPWLSSARAAATSATPAPVSAIGR